MMPGARGLFAGHYTETHYLEDGSAVSSSHNSTTNCYYHGEVEGHASSDVSLSTCTGIRGLISLGEAAYVLEPSPDRSDGTHRVYRAEHLALSAGSCGHHLNLSGPTGAPPHHSPRRPTTEEEGGPVRGYGSRSAKDGLPVRPDEFHVSHPPFVFRPAASVVPVHGGTPPPAHPKSQSLRDGPQGGNGPDRGDRIAVLPSGGMSRDRGMWQAGRGGREWANSGGWRLTASDHAIACPGDRSPGLGFWVCGRIGNRGRKLWACPGAQERDPRGARGVRSWMSRLARPIDPGTEGTGTMRGGHVACYGPTGGSPGDRLVIANSGAALRYKPGRGKRGEEQGSGQRRGTGPLTRVQRPRMRERRAGARGGCGSTNCSAGRRIRGRMERPGPATYARGYGYQVLERGPAAPRKPGPRAFSPCNQRELLF
ncbi:unnamed protein product [Arctogadus glacialis]